MGRWRGEGVVQNGWTAVRVCVCVLERERERERERDRERESNFEAALADHTSFAAAADGQADGWLMDRRAGGRRTNWQADGLAGGRTAG